MFLRDNFTLGQLRQFYLTEKIRIKCQQRQTYSNSFISNISNSFLTTNTFNLESKRLVIYPYSLSQNLLKEVLLKMGLKFVLTNEIQKANLIVGFKKHLKQNFKLMNLAKQKNIPVYGFNQISLYQIRKLFQLIIDS